MDLAEAYFIISGLVIDAASMGMKAPGPQIFFYRCNVGRKYCDDAENLFMSTSFGDTILALDAPFKLSFGEDGEETILDADGGIMAVYGLKYEVDGDKGIVFKSAGIIFRQHLTSKNHHNQMHIFSAQMAPRLAQFGAQIAVQQSKKSFEAASSISCKAVDFWTHCQGLP